MEVGGNEDELGCVKTKVRVVHGVHATAACVGVTGNVPERRITRSMTRTEVRGKKGTIVEYSGAFWSDGRGCLSWVMLVLECALTHFPHIAFGAFPG